MVGSTNEASSFLCCAVATPSQLENANFALLSNDFKIFLPLAKRSCVVVIEETRIVAHLTKKSRPTFLAQIGCDHNQKKSHDLFL